MAPGTSSPFRRNREFRFDSDGVLRPLCQALTSMGVHPNMVTLAGVLLTLMVPVEIVHEKWPQAGLWFLGAGFFDLLDGALAREGGFQSRFGAFWDSTLDRVSEAFVFGGLLLYYVQHQQPGAFLLAYCVCVLSFLVPYARARAEGLGIASKKGLLQRPGRVILLALGFLISRPIWALVIVGVLSLVTLCQRCLIVREKGGKKNNFK